MNGKFEILTIQDLLAESINADSYKNMPKIPLESILETLPAS